MLKEPGYRLNVGLIIVNNAGKLLICKRKGQDAWQFPQGGIDFGEKPLETAYRELHEEVGIDRSSVKLLSENINWEKYFNNLPFNKSALALYDWAPIAEELKTLDRKIVLNSMILKWDNIKEEFEKLINF